MLSPYHAMYSEVMDELDEINDWNSSFQPGYLDDEREEDARMHSEAEAAEMEEEEESAEVQTGQTA